MTNVTLQNPSMDQASNSNDTLHKNQNAVVLLSGGLDSVTCLYWAKARYASVTAVSFDYGQRHNSELVAAKRIAETAGVNHRIIDIDIAQLGGSSLTDHSMIVPDGDTDKFPNKKHDEIDNDAIPNTYVPARNTIFLSYALAVAEVTDANHIVIGVSSVDYSGYPDCRPDFANTLQQMHNHALEGLYPVTLYTPYIHKTKADIASDAALYHVPIEQTWSCYKGNDIHCGKCGTCVERIEALHLAKVNDPTTYEDHEFWRSQINKV